MGASNVFVCAPQNATHRSGQEGYTLYIDGGLEILKTRRPPKESVQDIRNRTWHVVGRLDTTSLARLGGKGIARPGQMSELDARA